MHFFARAMGARHSSLLPARQLNMGYNHKLLTPNEGINQRNVKIWANVAEKIYFFHTLKFRIEV